MKPTLFKSVVIAASLFTMHAAQANKGISYNYAGIQYVDQNIDQYDCSQDGLQLNGSFDLNGEWFALGGFSDVSGNHGCGSQAIQLGAGYHTTFNKQFDIYGSLRYEDVSVDHGDGDSGLIAAAGFRGFLAPKVEAKIEVAHHTVFDGNTELNGGIAYWLQKEWAVTADVSLGSDTTGIAVGLRLNF